MYTKIIDIKNDVKGNQYFMECFVYENGNDIEYKYIGKEVF